MYASLVPRLWSETVDAHRQAVSDAILDATATLVLEGGLAAATMSAIAERSGIGRATLYKYFPDIDAILTAWHARQVAEHLQRLAAIGHDRGEPAAKLEVVLTEYAMIQLRHNHPDPPVPLHRGDKVNQVNQAHHRLSEFMRELIGDAVAVGAVRDDVPVDELASYCVHALTAARQLHSEAAAKRLVMITVSALQSPRRNAD